MHEALFIKKICLRSVNKKYCSRNFRLTPQYRDFKNELFFNLIKPKKTLNPPYKITIYIKTYLDIDNPVKAIHDVLENGIISNDRKVHHLEVIKIEGKRGHLSSLRVFVTEKYQIPKLNYFDE